MGFMIACIVMLLVCQHSVHSTTQHCSGAHQGESYCKYFVGDPQSKIVISAPHGGSLKPSAIPNRDEGCYNSGSCVYFHSCGSKSSMCSVKTFKDFYTRELSIILRDKLEELSGYRPHLIVNDLHRSKMDGNREVSEATFHVPEAEKAFYEFHGFISTARNAIAENGLFIDMHGQTHAHGKNEFGYLVTSSRLNSNTSVPGYSSLKGLSGRVSDSFESILRGPKSLGYFLQIRGYEVIPSPDNPFPGNGGYYSGGYNTRLYGSRYGGLIDAVQIETHKNFRNSIDGPMYAEKLAEAVKDFMDENMRRHKGQNC